MATELIKKIVDGEEYDFEQFGAKQSLKILMRLSKLLGKPFIMALPSFKGKNEPLDAAVLAAAASVLFQSIDETETLYLFDLLTAEKVLCNGKRVVFDSHYEGKLTHLFKVLMAALEVQYGNFFVALIEIMDVKKMPEASTPA